MVPLLQYRVRYRDKRDRILFGRNATVIKEFSRYKQSYEKTERYENIRDAFIAPRSFYKSSGEIDVSPD